MRYTIFLGMHMAKKKKTKCGRCGKKFSVTFSWAQYRRICRDCYHHEAREADKKYAAKQRLEAAAPELLVVAEKIMNAWSDGYPGRELMPKLEAVLDKIQGR